MILAETLKALDATPPALAWNAERAERLQALEALLNANCPGGQPFDLYQVKPNPVWEAVAPRIEAAVREASETIVEPGVVAIWQLYGSGMLVKSGNQLLGFDVIPMPRFFGWDEPEGLTQRVADVLDALFITHRHEDHCDMALIEACTRKGIPVFLPDSVAETLPASPHLHPMTDEKQVSVGDAEVTGRQDFHVWRETMNDPQLIYYEVNLANGFTLIFGGDVDYTRGLEYTPGKTVDLLVIPWRNPNARFEDGHPEQEGATADAVQIAIDRVHPRALLHNHYGELDHIYKWGLGASYSMALDLKQRLPTPSEVLFWGEHLRVKARGANG